MNTANTIETAESAILWMCGVNKYYDGAPDIISEILWFASWGWNPEWSPVGNDTSYEDALISAAKNPHVRSYIYCQMMCDENLKMVNRAYLRCTRDDEKADAMKMAVLMACIRGYTLSGGNIKLMELGFVIADLIHGDMYEAAKALGGEDLVGYLDVLNSMRADQPLIAL